MTSILMRILSVFLLVVGSLWAQKSSMLQLTSKGSVIGFEKRKLYIANLHTALTIEFLGANDTQPLKEENKVVYKNLYEGIELAYDTSEGIVKSTYTIVPKANVAAIRLRYNAKLSITKDGKLTFTLPTKKGSMQATPPVAW